jgi:hypothetical protein
MSAALSLPARCPLLGHCERRAHTIALANQWPLEEAATRVGLRAPIVASVGESAYLIGGETAFVVGGQCPEVNLFENTVALAGFSGVPTVKGEYDKYMNPRVSILETGHFSQCAEYVTSRTTPPVTGTGFRAWVRRNPKWIVTTLVTLAERVAGFFVHK